MKEFSKPDIMEEDPTTEKERDEEYKVREKEFVSAIDKNKDGVATKEEMMVGLTPCWNLFKCLLWFPNQSTKYIIPN